LLFFKEFSAQITKQFDVDSYTVGPV